MKDEDEDIEGVAVEVVDVDGTALDVKEEE